MGSTRCFIVGSFWMEKRRLAVCVYSHRAISSFFQTPYTLIDGRAHCPGSAAKSVLIVGSPSRGYSEFIQLQDGSCREKKQRFYNQVKLRGPRGGQTMY